MQASCITDPGIPIELPARQESLGRIGFVTGRGEPVYSFNVPLEGKGEGAAQGALGMSGVCLSALPTGPVGVAFAILCLPVAAVGGAMFGAAITANADAVAEARAGAQRGFDTLRLNDVALRAGTEYGSAVGLPLHPLDRSLGPKGPGELPGYENVSGKVDSVLEIDIVSVDATSTGLTGVPITFDVEARTRLLDVRDGRALYSRDVHYVTAEHTADQWLAGDGRLLQESLEAAVKDVVVRTLDAIMDEFLVYRPAGGTKAAFDFDGRVPGYVLQPIEPPLRVRPFGAMFKPDNYCDAEGVAYGLLERYRLESLQPTFRWEPIPREFGLPLGNGPGEAHDIRYEFRILGGSGDAYRRAGLTEPTHMVEEPLAQCSQFRWTVRARFTLDGVPRATEWMGAFNTIGGYADPAWIRGHPGKPALAAIPSDMTMFFPIILTPSAHGEPCTCGSEASR